MSTNERDSPQERRPTAFALEAEEAARIRRPQAFSDNVSIVDDRDDPFLGAAELEAEAALEAQPRRRGFSWRNLALGALGAFLSMAFWLWADQVVRDLFSRSDWLGYLAAGLLALAALALIVIIGREAAGLMRLGAVQSLKSEAQQIASKSSPNDSRHIISQLEKIVSHRPETKRGRAALDNTKGDIIDAPQLLELAERELLTPLDQRARAMILASAKRTSVVTAVSPRAVVDLAYVLYEVTRLVRSMAELYGGRPGTLGLFRLLRDVIAHLAVTGSIAVGDSIAQQVLGHGLAAKLSTRLGEGVINGLLTARIGIAAMDLCRPLPFRALKRPGIGDFLGDLTTLSKPPTK